MRYSAKSVCVGKARVADLYRSVKLSAAKALNNRRTMAPLRDNNNNYPTFVVSNAWRGAVMSPAALTLLIATTLAVLSHGEVVDCAVVVDNTPQDCDELPQAVRDDIASYAPVVDRIVDLYLNGEFKGQLYKRLADFVDEFGSRISGSQSLEDSIDYMIAASNAENLDNVHKEPVKVPKWVRGKERLTMLKPRHHELPMLGLGLSVGTPPDGIRARAIVVRSFEELKAMDDADVAGKIVIYNQPFVSYRASVHYRSNGAIEAAKKGAVAALVRSITPFEDSTPHTGMMNYNDNVTKIPIAAISVVDADYLWREYKRSKDIEVLLKMGATQSEAISHNVIAELKGSEDKVVVVSGHIDSWDVGYGAMDDAGGMMLSWLSVVAMKHLNLKPKRTVRSIMWTAEEQGYIGAVEYERTHKERNAELSFVMESDIGVFKPMGINYLGHKDGECVIKEVLKLFSAVNSTEMATGDAGPDIEVFTNQGIPGAGIYSHNERYFWYHHSINDAMNIFDERDLDLAGALWTGFAYIMADMQYEIPRIVNKQ